MTVVAGVDDSEVAFKVLERATAEARWRDADLHLVHVASAPIVYADVAVDMRALLRAQRERVWGQLENALESVDVPMKRIELEGYPADTLVDYAQDVDADLIVIGNRGRGGVTSLVLGSTSHRVIHEATGDVLIVRGS